MLTCLSSILVGNVSLTGIELVIKLSIVWLVFNGDESGRLSVVGTCEILRFTCGREVVLVLLLPFVFVIWVWLEFCESLENLNIGRLVWAVDDDDGGCGGNCDVGDDDVVGTLVGNVWFVNCNEDFGVFFFFVGIIIS
jgi:hypothetical protein